MPFTVENSQSRIDEDRGNKVLNSTDLSNESEVIGSDDHYSFDDTVNNPGVQATKLKKFPLRQLLKNYENITGPSIKFATTPITAKRIERIRNLAAERTRSAPPKMYKVLQKFTTKANKEKQRQQIAKVEERSQQLDDHSLSDTSLAEEAGMN